ncbi:MAG TPA: glycosyltransferase [Kineosporiaceae bacterium]
MRLRVATVITRMQAGAGGVALRGALALDRDRYDVTFLVGSGDRLLDRAAAEGFATAVIPALVPQISPRDDARALLDLRSLVAGGRYDVVHTHSAKAGTLGRLAALWAGTPVVVHTLHGFPFHPYQPRPLRAAYVAVERSLGRRSTVLLAVGAGVAAEAVRLGLAPPDRIRTIGAAVDDLPARDGATRRAARRLLAVPPGMSVVGCVGRLDYQKAPEHFLAALADLDRRDVLGVWLGDGPLRAEVERTAAAVGLADRFVCLGDRADIGRVLPGVDVFAMPSRYEGLPCALLEAMAVGVPAVATAVNSVPDVLVPGETGLLVPVGRPAMMARAIGYLLDRPDEANRMAQAGRERVVGRYTGDVLGAVLEQVYRVPAAPGPIRVGTTRRDLAPSA